MKKLSYLLIASFMLMTSCSKEEISITSDEQLEVINLETFIPHASLQNTPKGKYVGILGHYANRSLHGKLFINNGQFNQFDALLILTNGINHTFKGIPQSQEGTIVYFEGNLGSFIIDFSEFDSIITSSVQFNDEQEEGYLVLNKNNKGVDPFVITGTYEDSISPEFDGNWDLIGNGITNIINVTLGPPLVPFPVTVNVPTQNIATLSVSHSGSTNPLLDNTFETNTAVSCIEGALPGSDFPDTPLMISADIPNPLGGVLGGEGSVSSGGQSSLFNGSNASWSLSYGDPIPAAMFDGGFTDDACNTATSGSWSWNGRSGTISIDGI